MKITDDYKAKLRIWANSPVVVPLPVGPKLPFFTAKKFSSHEEMNRWKQSLLREIAKAAQ